MARHFFLQWDYLTMARQIIKIPQIRIYTHNRDPGAAERGWERLREACAFVSIQRWTKVKAYSLSSTHSLFPIGFHFKSSEINVRDNLWPLSSTVASWALVNYSEPLCLWHFLLSTDSLNAKCQRSLFPDLRDFCLSEKGYSLREFDISVPDDPRLPLGQRHRQLRLTPRSLAF